MLLLLQGNLMAWLRIHHVFVWCCYCFLFLLFPIGVNSFVVVGIDCTGTEHFAVGFHLVFLHLGTSLTVFLYHLVFPPGF
jgi:hypothetical protein